MIALGTALKHWKLIAGGIVLLALITALMLTRDRLAGVKLELAAERAAHAETIANYKLAQEAATALAERHRRDLEALSRSNADEADDRYAKGLADARSGADAYIAAHRLQPGQCVGGAGSGAVAATDDQRPGVPSPMSTEAELVSVTPADVRACSAAVEFGDRAHAWAMTLQEKP